MCRTGLADNGPIAERHFDGGSGSVLHDDSGNEDDGVIECERAQADYLLPGNFM